MGISHDLLSQLAKTVKEDKKQSPESIVYGSVKTDSNGNKYVQLDGSDQLTPLSEDNQPTVDSTTTNMKDGDRVSVLIKNHTATITGNISAPSVSNDDVETSITNFDIAIGEQIQANRAYFKELIADDVKMNKLSAAIISVIDLVATEAEIEELIAGKITVTDLIADKIDADVVIADKAVVDKLKANDADILSLLADNATIENLIANKVTINSLIAKKLSAEEADLKYANINFANITEAAVKKIFADYGVIKELHIDEATVVKELVGVLIKGDLIEAGTLKVDRLVVKGSDGQYYALTTDFSKLEGVTPVAEDAIHGSVLVKKSIAAEKISVSDLVAFGATIGGFHITDNSIYSGVKESVGNTTRGIFLDNDGQIAFGDESNYLKFYKESEGVYKLAISASSITMSASGKSVETIVEEVEQKVDNIQVGGRNLLIRKNLISGYIDRGTWDIYEYSSDYVRTTEWIDISDCKYITITLYDEIPYSNTMVDDNNGAPIHAGCLFSMEPNGWSGIEFVDFNLTSPGHVTIPKPEGASYMGATLFGCNRYRYKIEKGNVSTDYAEAPEDANVDIEVGGRNLLIRKNVVGGYIWSEGFEYSGDGKTGDLTTDWIDISGCKNVTITLYDSFTNDVNIGRYALYDSDKNLVTIDEYNPRTPNSVTVPVPERAVYLRATLIDCLTYRYKIEKGTVSTDYTLAPEDSEVVVGGRNLLLTSNVKIEGDGYQLGSYDITDSNQIVAGDTYTISFNGTMNEDVHTGFYLNIGGEPYPTILNQEEIQFKNGRYYGTFKMPEVPYNGIYEWVGVYMQPWDHNTLGGSVWNIKLEKGNVATDWTPAPEDVDKSIEDAATVGHTAYAEAHNAQNAANNANDRLDNMSIGGRNFIRNSAFLDGSLHWSFNKTECCEASLDTQRTRHGHPSVRIRGCDTHQYIGLQCKDNFDTSTYPMKDLQVGDTVTLSFWYYCEDASTIDNGFAVNLEGMRADGSQVTFGFKSIHHGAGEIVSGEWTRYELTVTADDNYAAVGCYVYLIQNGVVWVTDFKLEKGNVATDWTPATEDMASAENLNALTTTVIQYQSELNQTTESIRMSVERVETTTKESIDGVQESVDKLNERVDVLVDEEKVQIMVKEQLDNHETKSVTTETGFRFDKDGLNITKSTSNVNTKITEDGMKVYKKDEVDPTLSATSAGVDAKNLHARTYLIIGNNSRFEDYAGNRTGCFFIGN